MNNETPTTRTRTVLRQCDLQASSKWTLRRAENNRAHVMLSRAQQHHPPVTPSIHTAHSIRTVRCILIHGGYMTTIPLYVWYVIAVIDNETSKRRGNRQLEDSPPLLLLPSPSVVWTFGCQPPVLSHDVVSTQDRDHCSRPPCHLRPGPAAPLGASPLRTPRRGMGHPEAN